MSHLSSSSLASNPPQQNPGDDLSLLRRQSLQNIANGSLILGTILFFVNLFVAIQQNQPIIGIFVFLLYGAVFISTFMQSFSVKSRVTLLFLAYLGAGTLSAVSTGLNAIGVLFLFTGILILAIFLEKNEWLWGILLSAILLAVFATLVGYGIIEHDFFAAQSTSPLYWSSVIIFLIFIAYLITSTVTRNLQTLRNLISDTRNENLVFVQKDQTLSSQITTLEIELDRRRSRLIAARQIAREISQTTDFNSLLKESVELVRTQFGYSHAGIFLKDSKSEYAVLRAATGEAGKTMLARQHKLKIRDEGIVGYVVAKGEVRIASNVGDDAVHFKNPLLPGTKSEMALPLRTGDAIIGALDIQSDKQDAFSNEDVEVIQTIADQLASAIDKAQQIQQLKHTITELEEGYRTFTSGAWQAHLKGTGKKFNYLYDKDHVSVVDQTVPLFNETITAGKAVITKPETDKENATQSVMIAVPIKLRDQILGVMNLKYDGKKLPEDLVNLMNTASDRLAVALENARLLEEVQERAETEHVVGNIANKVRASSDIDTILRTTAVELGKSLGIDEVRIQLKTAGKEN